MNTEVNIKQGGKVLASGGFGCVFSPALKCIGENKRDKGKITKLMINKHAKNEYDEIEHLHDKLSMIPNYSEYFLIDDFTLCKPSKLTKSDLKNYTKCTALQKEKITAKNINKSLTKLTALNMPYGGNNLENFIITNKSYEKLISLNHKMMNLLKNGILEMNKKHIYHSDIKASNILFLTSKNNDGYGEKVRLIDWSLTVEYIPFKSNPFPKNWKNRPLQFNVPFSVVLFTGYFVDSYTKFLNIKENKSLLAKPGSRYEILFLFIKNYLSSWMQEIGIGHFKYINKIMYMLFKYDDLKINDKRQTSSQTTQTSQTIILRENESLQNYIETKYTIPCIVDYLVNVLIHFIKMKHDGSLDMRYYLDNIFVKIIDIWGFIISYLPLYELLFENYHNLTHNQMHVFDKLKYIFLKYLYQPENHLIKVKNLEVDLNQLNNLIKKCKI